MSKTIRETLANLISDFFEVDKDKIADGTRMRDLKLCYFPAFYCTRVGAMMIITSDMEKRLGITLSSEDLERTDKASTFEDLVVIFAERLANGCRES